MSTEIEVSAKDEEAAEVKATEKIDAAIRATATGKHLDEAFSWDESSDDDSFEYEIDEA